MPALALPALGLAALLCGPGASLELDRAWLRDLPASHDAWSLVETVDPFCIVDRIDGGGLYRGEPGRVGCHGSSWTQASFQLDGVDVTDPDRGGAALIEPDLLVLESVRVTRDRLPVWLAGAGPAFAYRTRRPGAWSGSLEAEATGAALQASAVAPTPIARYGRARRLAGWAQGPLAREHLFFSAGAAAADAERRAPDSPGPLQGSDLSLVLQLAARPRAEHEARALVVAQRVARPLAGRALYASRDLQETDRRVHAQASWQRSRAGQGTVLAAGYTRASLAAELPGAPGGVVERLLDGPPSELSPESSRRERWHLQALWRGSRGRLAPGPHRLEVQASLAGALVTARPAAPAGLVGETVDGLPARLWEYGLAGPESRRRTTALSLGVADRIAPTSRLEIEGGARLETTAASAEGGARLRWWTLAPRLAVRWRALSQPAGHLYGGYAAYPHRLPLRALAFGDPAGPSGASYLWRDANGDRLPQPAERGALLARLGPGGPLSSVAPDLRLPETEELVLGAELAPVEGWLLRFQAIHRQERDLLESLNVGVAAEGYTARRLPDPYVDFVGADDDRELTVFDREPASFGMDRYRLDNPGGHSMLHEGFELAAQKTRGRLRLVAGAAAYRSEARSGWRGFRSGENDQGLIGELFDDPNADSYARGRLFFDRNYVVKLAGRYQAPRGVRLAAALRYQDGQPFARFVVVEDLRQGPDFVHAVPEGRHRFSYTLTLDARVERGFALGRARAALVAEAFNLLDARNSVEEEVVSVPAFRERLTRFRQPPRAVRLGVRLDF